MNAIRLFCALVLSLNVSSAAVAAQVVLQYTGGSYFTNVRLPYSGFDRVTGTVILAQNLDRGLNMDTVSPLSFDFFDGVHHVTNRLYNQGSTRFQFSTDALGKITLWSIAAVDYIGGVNTVNQLCQFCTRESGFQYSGGFGESRDSPGTWIASVPEPATWAMLVIGFGLVGAAARRREVAVTA